jgi:hypothetical protein|tara:strand:+ start:2608 stop:3228 length:621 start_codon:yes stop_codon:yes gene_type:complete
MGNNKLKWSLEKLFNSLGRNMAMKYYGFDSKYEVVKIINVKTGDEVTDFEGDIDYEVIVKSKDDLPEIFDVKIEPLWRYGKFAQPMDLQFNLEHITKYISPSIIVSLVTPEWKEGDLEYTSVKSFEKKWGRSLDLPADDFQKNPSRWVELSNGSVVDKITGNSFPLMSNGLIDKTEVWNIARIDEDEWWDSLDNNDKQNLTDAFSK